MSSRVAGAGLALIAAALFAVSLATPVALPAELSLFAGHPTVNGHTLEMQDVYVGFYGAQLCNTGGDGTCKSRDPKRAFKIAAFAELGVTGLLGASAFVLALLTLRTSERRKPAARFVRVLTVMAAAGAGALIFLGPTDQGSIPLGLGLGLYGGGVLGALLASVFAARQPPPIKLRVADRGLQPAPAIRAPVPAPPPFDMQALFGEDQPRPGELRPAPRLGPPNGAELDEPSDPLAVPPPPPGSDKPLFASAPQLRPLYDATPLQGGTGGLLPIERPVMPAPPPTARRPKTLPPPNFGARGKPSSVPPPIPPGASPRTQVSLVPPMPDHDAVPAPPTAHVAPPRAAPPRAEVASDERPDRGDAPPNTEPSLFPTIETPLAQPPMPEAPVPRPRVETPLAPPPPPIAPAAPPPPRRGSPTLPRPSRETQSPRPGLRAAVPMPARPGRQTASPTRPPPLSIPSPLRGDPPRPAISAPGAPPPNIPAIPAIPAIPMPASRAEADPHERGGTIDQGIDPATGSRIPVEIGDDTSQTHVSFSMVTAEELDAAVDGFALPRDAPGHVHGGADRDDAIETEAEPGSAEATTAGEPLDPLDDLDRAASLTDTSDPAPAPGPAAAPVAAPPLPPMPVAVAPLPVSPVARDRPMPKLPITTAPDSLPPPKDGKQQSGPSPACPQCEAPMAWVEEHLRFYCKSCRMYF